ncbi:hypothetical protein ASE11_23160 [Hydrogenophaga sp. Root209]|nr:hypothetical protein ASE11_23160 [Hydrogenophaga sp. Root209]
MKVLVGMELLGVAGPVARFRGWALAPEVGTAVRGRFAVAGAGSWTGRWCRLCGPSAQSA